MNVFNKTMYWAKVFALYSPFIVLLVALKTRNGHSGDLQCWNEWAKFSFNNGISNIYKSWTDYLPLYHYVLFCYGKIQGNEVDIVSNIYQLKYVSLFFEFCSAILLFKILEEKFNNLYKSLFFSLFFFLNISIMYNTLVWGQVDGILSFFIMLSIIAAYKRSFFVALLGIILALNFKLQAIIFLPIVITLLLPLFNKNNLKNILVSTVLIATIQILILMPFIIAGDLLNIWNIIKKSSEKYPYVSMNAYNFWYWFFSDNFFKIKDTEKLWSISYKQWGIFMFFTTSFFVLFSFIKQSLLFLYKGNTSVYEIKNILIVSSLIPLLFFFFNTEMHERYSHSALIFLSCYSLLYGRYILLVLGSIAYYLNMEDVLQYMQNYKYYDILIFRPDFIAFLFLLLIILLALDLFNYKIKLSKS